MVSGAISGPCATIQPMSESQARAASSTSASVIMVKVKADHHLPMALVQWLLPSERPLDGRHIPPCT